jgi:hypothetical protein
MQNIRCHAKSVVHLALGKTLYDDDLKEWA